MSSEQRKLKKGAGFMFTALICVIVVVIIAVAIHQRQTRPVSSTARSSSGSAAAAVSSGITSVKSASSGETALGGLLMLVNKDHKMQSDYTPDFVKVPSSYYCKSDKDNRFDSRAAKYLESMIDAGRAAGSNLVIYSGYRTYAYQQSNFNRHVKAYEAKGETSTQAKIDAAKLVAPAGTSEHETGLAADIVSTEYLKSHTDLTADFDKTAAFTWLYANCAKYGFILRYTEDKVSVTKYDYESWHFRFVGVDNAKKIMSGGLCLEEYVAKLK